MKYKYVFNMSIDGFMFTKSNLELSDYNYASNEYFLYYYAKLNRLTVTAEEFV